MRNPFDKGPVMAPADGEHGSVEGRNPREVMILHAKEAADVVLDKDSNIQNQFLLGGDFLDENGKPRGRKIFSLDVPELADRYLPLYKLCIKIDELGRGFEKEFAIQKEIQNEIDAGNAAGLSVARMIEILKDGKNFKEALLMERLPRNDKNGSVQSLRSSARNSGMAFFISDEVAARISQAYEALHGIGFLHGDINEGNIYLLNASYRDYQIPRQSGKIRPRMARYVFNADVKLLDFEMASKTGAKAGDPVYQGEVANVDALLDEEALPIGGSVDLHEFVEAVDEYQSERRAKRVA